MSVRVVARIRPLLEKELGKDVIVHAESTEEGRHPTVVKIPNPKNESEEFSFAFNSVYDQPTGQEELFNAEGKMTTVPPLYSSNNTVMHLAPLAILTSSPSPQWHPISRLCSRVSTSPYLPMVSRVPGRRTRCAAA